MNPYESGSSSRRVVVSGNLTRPVGLRVDPEERMLYWIDTDSAAKEFRIERAELDGSGRTLVCSGKV